MSQQQIIYALVTRGSTVLSEYYPDDIYDRVNDGISALLTRLDSLSSSSNSGQSFMFDGSVFHCVLVDGLTFICMADAALPRLSAYQFLRDLAKVWFDIFRDLGQTARAYQMNSDFSRVIQQQIEIFQMKHEAQSTPDRIALVNQEISKTKDVMVQNIDRVLERGDKIELLVDKTENLETSAVRFRRAAREVRSSACWAAWRTTVVAAVVAVLVLYGILALSCGGADIPQCR